MTTYLPDAVGNVIEEKLVDANDPSFEPRIVETDYDELNRPIEVRRNLREDSQTVWVTLQAKYDGEGNKVLEIDPLGRVTEHRYDEVNRLIETVEPEWKEGSQRTTHNVYDANGNLIKTTLFNEPEDQVREQGFDALNRLVLEKDALGNERTREYDAVGNLIRQIDRRLNATSFGYDERDRRIKTTIHLNRATDPSRDVVTTYVYDDVGNRTEEHWANGNVVVHSYEKLSRLKSSTDNLGKIVSRTYDARGNVVEERDGNDHPTANSYDALDRLVSQQLPEDRTLGFTYDVAGNKLTETNARSFTTTFVYDSLNRLVETEDPPPFSYTTRFTYDLVGNRRTETDRRGHETTFDYDGLNRLIRRIEPPLNEETAPLQIEYTYDAADNRLTEVDRRGILTEYTYDAENRQTSTTRAGIVIEQSEYDAEENLILLTDANLNVTGFEYDERNLKLAESRPLAAITRFTYDDMGDLLSVRDPEGRITQSTYDKRRRQETQTQVLEGGSLATTTYGYDGNGNRTSVERPEEGTWIYAYDKANRLIGVTDPETGYTSYEYDKNGNLRFQYDANENPTEFQYDELDRMTRKEYADGAFEASVYDENGNLLEHRDAKGQVTTFDYDALNRQTLADFSEDPNTVDDLQSIARVYDANNNVTEVKETFSGLGDQLTTRTYDAFDRLETVIDRWGNELRYAYDANGNRTHLVDPSDRVTGYAYDALNRLMTVTTSAGVTEYTFFRDSRIHQIRYPSGTTAGYAYDEAGRIHSIDNRHNGALVSYFSYLYDLNGNRLEQFEERSGQGGETTTYDYDLADRLRVVLYPEKTTTYTYDAVGNRRSELEVDANGTTISDKVYNYNVRNQLEQLDNLLDPTHSVTYGYDANGNQISRTTGAGDVTNLAFDDLDRLVRIEKDGTAFATYRYDAQDLRIEKLTADGTSRYVYDGTSVLTRNDANGTTKYEYGPDRLLSVDDPAEGRAYYVFDALDSVVNLMTPEGKLLARYKYDAWGNYRDVTTSEANPFGFTGHEHDLESGLIYAKARFYDAEIGLFLSEDPVSGVHTNPPSLHQYIYAFQNPTVYVDPTGREASEGEQGNKRILLAPGQPVPEGYEVIGIRSTGFRTAVPTESDGAEPKKLTIGERFSRWYEDAGGLVGQFREGVRRIRQGAAKAESAAEHFDEAARKDAPAATPQEEIAAFQSRRGKLKEAQGIVAEAADGGVDVAMGTLEAADAVVTVSGQTKLVKEGLELGIKAGSQGVRTLSREGVEGGTANSVSRRGVGALDDVSLPSIQQLERTARVTFNGMEVRAVRSLSHVDESTLRAMAEHGFAAKDIHGSKLVLHHLGQRPAGPLVEIPARRHSIGNRVQHPFGNTPGAGLSAQQRIGI